MISIIICSRKKTLPLDFLQNIETTIGVNYELVVIDNSENKYSIFEAYNIGIKKSKGHYWCFMHDDVLFHTQDWGLKIKQIFNKNNSVGLIGVAGAKIKTKMPSGWWNCPHHLMVTNMIHQLPNNKKEKQYHGFNDEDNVEVAVIDGVFMVARANASITFDEKLKGFHNYDLYLAIQYSKQQFKIVVTNQILIEHFSVGKIDKSWYESALTFNTLYSKFLPLNPIKSCEAKTLKRLEFKNGKLFCEKLLEYSFKKAAISFWIRLIIIKPISKFHIHFLKKLVN